MWRNYTNQLGLDHSISEETMYPESWITDITAKVCSKKKKEEKNIKLQDKIKITPFLCMQNSDLRKKKKNQEEIPMVIW